jgi:polysaccharide deacetylase family protein (PEP-CTERM system associated)
VGGATFALDALTGASGSDATVDAVQSFVLESAKRVASPIKNALTVDVEEYFQVAAFETTIAKADWNSSPSRVDFSTRRVLDLFGAHGAKATFFVLGWIAERHPTLVRRIVAEGHEIASHGYDHTRLHGFRSGQFRADVTRTKRILEDVAGVAVRGYRAPSYSIDRRNLWALDVLAETGHAYSSSIYPIRHDLYGMPDAPRFPFRLRPDSILEIPVTTVRLGSRNYPCGGGGYFRLLPYEVFRWMLRRVNARDRQPGLFYFHPWEVDPGQPRIQDAPLKSRFRHYLNLDSMHSRLERLLVDFAWGRMDALFLGVPDPLAPQDARSHDECAI